MSALGMSSMVAEITENTEKDSQNGEGNDTQGIQDEKYKVCNSEFFAAVLTFFCREFDMKY